MIRALVFVLLLSPLAKADSRPASVFIHFEFWRVDAGAIPGQRQPVVVARGESPFHDKAAVEALFPGLHVTRLHHASSDLPVGVAWPMNFAESDSAFRFHVAEGSMRLLTLDARAAGVELQRLSIGLPAGRSAVFAWLPSVAEGGPSYLVQILCNAGTK